MMRIPLRSRCAAALTAAIMSLAAGPALAQFNDVTSEASLVALWELNEAAASPTVSATNLNPAFIGTVSGGTTLGAASAMTTLGTAATFNGVNGKIDVPFNAALNTADYTVEAWAQVQGGSGHRSPLTSRGNAPAEGYIFYATPATSTWEHWSGPGWNVNTGPAVNNNQWVHLAGTYNNVTDVKVFYINGHPVSTNAGVTMNPNDASPLRIGAGASEAAGTYFFNGAVDNVAVMNSPLAHQNIADHFNSKSNYANRVAIDAPLAFWRLGEQAGATGYNSMNVTAHSGTYVSTTLRTANSDIANNIDTAAQFNGSSSRLTVPFTASLNPAGDFSIEAWARPTGGAGSYRSVLTSRNGSGTFSGYIFYAGSDNNWQFWNGTGSAWDIMTGTPVGLNDWVHLVGTYDAATGTKEFYIDGVLVDSATGIAYAPNAVDPLHIGAGDDLGGSFFFPGAIDEVAVYDYVLSAADIDDHFQTGVTGQFIETQAVPEPASIALWSLLGVGLLVVGWRARRWRRG